jgi:hypothetical protein
MSHRLLAGAAALALLAAPAVAAAEVHRFTAVDAAESGFLRLGVWDYLLLAITGVDETGAEVTRRYVAAWGNDIATMVPAKEACDRMALMALAKPGRYVLQITDYDATYETPMLYSCKLIRND